MLRDSDTDNTISLFTVHCSLFAFRTICYPLFTVLISLFNFCSFLKVYESSSDNTVLPNPEEMVSSYA
jgi:hypothetical protein